MRWPTVLVPWVVILALLIGCGSSPPMQANSTANAPPPPDAGSPQIHSAAVTVQVNVGTDVSGGTIQYVDAQMGAGNMTTWGAPLTPSARYVTFSGAPLDLAMFRLANCGGTNPPPQCATPLYNDVYVRDTCIGAAPACAAQTQKISVAADGSPANGSSIVSTISDDGRYVAFESAATNLVTPSPPFLPAIYVRDTCVGAVGACTPSTALVSRAGDGTMANASSYRPRITSNGRYALFRSLASNLVQVDTNNSDDLFLRDTCVNAPTGCLPSTILVTVAPNGSQFSNGVVAGSMTPNGRFVTFTAWVATGGLPTPLGFLRDTCLGAPTGCVPSTVTITVDANGAPLKTASFAGSVSSDGRYVYFDSGDPALLPGCTPDPVFGTCGSLGYLRDTCFNAPAGCVASNTRVTLGSGGSLPNNNRAGGDIDSSGRFVVFTSAASNLVANDTNASTAFDGTDIFVRDTCQGAGTSCQPATVRVNVAADGTQADNYSLNQATAAGGSYVTFWSLADTLIPGTPPQPPQGQVFRLYLSKVQ